MPRRAAAVARATKRQNFNVTPEQEAEIDYLRNALDAPTAKDAILRAVRLAVSLAREVAGGSSIYVRDSGGALGRLLLPELGNAGSGASQFLVARPHPWRRQLYVKGRRLRAANVWADMVANGMSAEDAADNWDLPLPAVEEIVRYCEEHEELLAAEAEEEWRRLADGGGAINSGNAA